jgi:hypothetical protein
MVAQLEERNRYVVYKSTPDQLSCSWQSLLVRYRGITVLDDEGEDKVVLMSSKTAAELVRDSGWEVDEDAQSTPLVAKSSR